MEDIILKNLMFVLDAKINEDGDIICLLCGLPNECCICELSNLTLKERS